MPQGGKIAREGISAFMKNKSTNGRGKPRSVKTKSDLVGVGLYAAAEAARIASFATTSKLPAETVRRWVRGYSYRHENKVAKSKELIHSTIDLDGAYVLSFAELVELLYIAAFRRENLSLRLIRAIHDLAKKELKCQHPFATRKFYTDGKNILWELTKGDVDVPGNKEHLLEDIKRKHIVIDEVVRPFLRNLDYINDIASAFWPLGRDRRVLISPKRSFGRAIEKTTGVPTEAIFSAHQAGESEESIAEWFECSLEGVKDALHYERALLNPALKAA